MRNFVCCWGCAWVEEHAERGAGSADVVDSQSMSRLMMKIVMVMLRCLTGMESCNEVLKEML